MKLIVPLFIVGLTAGAASAQSNSAQAEKLFKDGKALMAAEKYAEACEAFESSQRLEADIATLANLANCREKNGQIATAWGLYLQVEKQTRGDPNQKGLNETAKKRSANLETRTSYLIVNVPDESRVDGLLITLDGEPYETWNTSLPIDGGEHVVSGKAPGHEAWSTTVTVAPEGDKQSVDVPKFKSLPEVKAGGEPTEPPPAEEPEPPPTGMTGKRKVALVLGPVGVLALGAAIVFEAMARGTYDDASMEPDDDLQRDLTDRANSQRSTAIVLGVVGAASVGVAAYLWLTGARSERPSRAALAPTVTHDTVGVAWTTSF